MKYKNFQMETMLNSLGPILPHRDKAGYVAARNVRTLSDALTEYFQFKNELIQKYGEKDGDDMFINPNSPNWDAFESEFKPIAEIEQDINLMTMLYSETIGLLNGEEILKLDFMLKDEEEVNDNG